MSRTDEIIAAVTEELQHQRSTLDDISNPITSVGVLVLISERTGRPLKTICRMESSPRLGILG